MGDNYLLVFAWFNLVVIGLGGIATTEVILFVNVRLDKAQE